MTKTDLNYLASISAEIAQKERALSYMKDFYEKTGDEILLDDIAELEIQLDELKRKRDLLQPEIEKFINDNFPEERTILRLHYLRGFSWQEVGCAIGKSTNAVKMASSRAIKRYFE